MRRLRVSSCCNARIDARARTAGAVVLVLALAAPLISLDAAAQAEPDSASTEFDASFRFLPAPVWSRSAGFAAGVGFEVENAVRMHDRFRLTAKPGQHLGRYSATYFAGDPSRQSVYGLVNTYYETTGRQWYFGAGPSSSPHDRIAVEKEMFEVELRAGLQAAGRRLFIQPFWAYHRQHPHSVRNWDDGALLRLSDQSRRHLDAAFGDLPGTSALQHGTSYGVAAGIDLRDRRFQTRRGLLVHAATRRFRFQEPGELEYARYTFGVYGYVPLDGSVLAVRALLERTEADDGIALPFYMLPSLDGRVLPGYAFHRFFGNDLFALTFEYSVPLFQFSNVVAVDALLSAGAGNVYDDVFEQFESTISFDDAFEEGAESYPLRPSASAGFSLESAPRGWDVRILLGWGTEGVRLVKFGFIHDLQDIDVNKR